MSEHKPEFWDEIEVEFFRLCEQEEFPPTTKELAEMYALSVPEIRRFANQRQLYERARIPNGRSADPTVIHAVERSARLHLQKQGVKKLAREIASEGVHEVIEEEIDPVLVKVKQQLEELAAASSKNDRLLALTEFLPISYEQAVERGWKPKDFIEAIRLGFETKFKLLEAEREMLNLRGGNQESGMDRLVLAMREQGLQSITAFMGASAIVGPPPAPKGRVVDEER